MMRVPTYSNVPGYIGRMGMGDAFCEFMGLDASECGGGALPPVIIPESVPTPPYDPTFGGLLPPGGVAVPTGVTLPGITVAPGTNTGGLTTAQIAQLIASSAGAAGGLIRSTQTPYVIPGSAGLIYNPATGQVTSGAAVTGSAIGTAVSPTMIMIVVAVVILFSMGRK